MTTANFHNGSASSNAQTKRASPPNIFTTSSSLPVLSPYIHSASAQQNQQRLSPSNSAPSQPGSHSQMGGAAMPKPRRDQIQEFFKLVKDGKINEVNQALKSNHQYALSCDEKQNNALYYAASLGDKQMSDILLNSGSNVNHSGGDLGSTPLMAAAEKGFSQCCELYIKCGANVNAVNMAGNRALHLAASRGHHDVCRVLIESGAEISASNGKNLNAINEATAAQHYNLSDYLEQQMNQRMQPHQPPNTSSNSSGSRSMNGFARCSQESKSNERHPSNFSDLLAQKRTGQTPRSSHLHSSSFGSSGSQSPFVGFPIGDLLDRKTNNRNFGAISDSYSPPESNNFHFELPTQSILVDLFAEKMPGSQLGGDLRNSLSTESISPIDNSFSSGAQSKFSPAASNSSLFSSSSQSLESPKSSPTSDVRSVSPFNATPVMPNSAISNASFGSKSSSSSTTSVSTVVGSDVSSGLGLGLSNILSNANNPRPSANGSGSSNFNGRQNGSASNNPIGSRPNSNHQSQAGSNRHSAPNAQFFNSQLANNLFGLNASASMMGSNPNLTTSMVDFNGNHYSTADHDTASAAKNKFYSRSSSDLLDNASNASSFAHSISMMNSQQSQVLLDLFAATAENHANSKKNLLLQQLVANASQNQSGPSHSHPNQGVRSQHLTPNIGVNGMNLKQQMQIESLQLQYQILLNDLTRKNKELELRLSDMEADLCRLNVENYRLRMRLSCS